MGNAPLKLTLDGETDVIVTRRFDAPPSVVYRAHVEAELIRKWMLGPPDWTMPVCEIDARPGGRFRYVYAHDTDPGFSIEGEFVDLVPGEKIVHVERMFLPDPTPNNNVETRFEPDGTGTKMTMRMSLPDAATRKAMLDTGMADGMEMSYVALENLAEDLAA
jgi:uncharacterized protein YndB with AHSA1/START domain